jgi:hypothetical protein
MQTMKRFWLLFAGFAVVVVAALPAAASAQIVELGQTTTPIAPAACPAGTTLANCLIVLPRTTAIQSTSDGVTNPTVVKQAGWIVAFTVGLSNLTSNAKTKLSVLHGLDQRFGGVPMVALTVLKPGPKNTYTVQAQSGDYHLIPFLGQVLQEPLSLPPTFSTLTALPVKAGDVVALTVPTWAPVLTYDLSATKFSYRQSRRANCKNSPAAQTAQTTVGASAQYLCSYTGTRVEYSATEIVNKPYPKHYVH